MSRAFLLGVSLLTLWLLASPVPASAATGPRHEIGSAKLSQAGRSLILQVTTEPALALGRLSRRPDLTRAGARYLCFEFTRPGSRAGSRVCLGGHRQWRRRVGLLRISPAGRVWARKTVAARVKRGQHNRLVATVIPAAVGLAPGRWRWRVHLADGKCVDDRQPSLCVTRFPAHRRASYRVRPVRAVGCTGGNGQVVLSGPRRGKRVALTFDDGPGPYTTAVLERLRRLKVRATFFMLGMQVEAYPDLARTVLAGGHEIANHSSAHALLPGFDDIARASRTIRRATGFRPCLFRPPYGATSASLIESVRRAKMKSVIWDVDTNDWRLPGSASIRSAITGGVRPGSIVLMHDAGGPRGQTVDALPGAIRTLRRRGYRFVTVSELLGNRLIYRPVP